MHTCACVYAGRARERGQGQGLSLPQRRASSSRTQEAEAAWPFDRDPMLCLVQGIFKFSFILLSGFPPHLPSLSQVSRLLGPSSH